jgi:hypothetical protein
MIPRAISSGPQKLATPVSHVDVIGAGNFARTMLLPHLKDQIALGTVVNQTALSANHVKTKFAFQRAETDANEVLPEAGKCCGGDQHAASPSRAAGA